MNAEATRVRYIVVGIGINVNQAKFPADLQPIATSLRLATGTEWSRVELCAALLKSLDREYRDLLQKPGAHESILQRFRNNRRRCADGKYTSKRTAASKASPRALIREGFCRCGRRRGLRTVLSGTVRLK